MSTTSFGRTPNSLSKPMLGRISICDAACFAGLTLAVAVAAGSRIRKRPVKALAERCREFANDDRSAPLPVAEKDYPARALPWHKPSLQLRTVCRLERYILILKSSWMPVAGLERRDRINQPRFQDIASPELRLDTRSGWGRAIRHTNRRAFCHGEELGWSISLATPSVWPLPAPLLAMGFLIDCVKQRIDVLVLGFLIKCTVQEPSGVGVGMPQDAEHLESLGLARHARHRLLGPFPARPAARI